MPIEAKCYVEPPWDGGTKVCSNIPGHVTKMAVIPIYGKIPLKIFYETNRSMTFKLGMQHRGLGPTKIVQPCSTWVNLHLLYDEVKFAP